MHVAPAVAGSSPHARAPGEASQAGLVFAVCCPHPNLERKTAPAPAHCVSQSTGGPEILVLAYGLNRPEYKRTATVLPAEPPRGRLIHREEDMCVVFSVQCMRAMVLCLRAKAAVREGYGDGGVVSVWRHTLPFGPRRSSAPATRCPICWSYASRASASGTSMSSSRCALACPYVCVCTHVCASACVRGFVSVCLSTRLFVHAQHLSKLALPLLSFMGLEWL